MAVDRNSRRLVPHGRDPIEIVDHVVELVPPDADAATLVTADVDYYSGDIA